MRILVMSDSHGNIFDLELAIKQQPEAKHVIFLGDGERQINACKEKFPDRIFIAVKGNCDLYSPLKAVETFILGGKKIYITHGHIEQVKYGLTDLFFHAKEAQADIVLYGHTHVQFYDYCEGMHVFNPGSICEGKYGFIDIEENGIMCVHNEVKFK